MWQEGYFERILRDVDDAQDYVHYIINNPVRAGLGAGSKYTHGGSKEQDPPYTAD